MGGERHQMRNWTRFKSTEQKCSACDEPFRKIPTSASGERERGRGQYEERRVKDNRVQKWDERARERVHSFCPSTRDRGREERDREETERERERVK